MSDLKEDVVYLKEDIHYLCNISNNFEWTQVIERVIREKKIKNKSLKRLIKKLRITPKVKIPKSKLEGVELNKYLKSIITYDHENYAILNNNNHIINHETIKNNLEKFNKNIKISRNNLFFNYCELAKYIYYLLQSINKEFIIENLKYSRDTINKLKWLGKLISEFPKLKYLNITFNDFIYNRKNITELFSDKYKEENQFWKDNNINNNLSDISDCTDIENMCESLETDLSISGKEEHQRYEVLIENIKNIKDNLGDTINSINSIIKPNFFFEKIN
ncbi:uncharacterized protein LOC119651912 [Hermetia illucens]|uniref:uncharacterized protein LOC119651912 n=1 Tax=Hermetia illucens TaxID=343691 RepID=UPI0018CC1CEE|nr:uncharacterized protein LOC119651912 [Hermetia illucens]